MVTFQAAEFLGSGKTFLFLKAWHLIAMTAWFAGLFYLPRLFVYHSILFEKREAQGFDLRGHERFLVMESKLYRYIMWPAALVTSFLGIFLVLCNSSYYLHAGWMHLKLSFVLLLWLYHLCCGRFLLKFTQSNSVEAEFTADSTKKSLIKSSKFFRLFNELPTLILVAVVLLVILKPF